MERGKRADDAAQIEQAAEVFRQAGAKTYLALALHALETVQAHGVFPPARKEQVHLQLPSERKEEAA